MLLHNHASKKYNTRIASSQTLAFSRSLSQINCLVNVSTEAVHLVVVLTLFSGYDFEVMLASTNPEEEEEEKIKRNMNITRQFNPFGLISTKGRAFLIESYWGLNY